MRYLQIKTGPTSDEPLPWWCRLLRRIIPSGNDDLEPFYSRVQTWWLEVDDAGAPQREIGFDVEMKPVVLGPVADNCGFLLDASDDWSDSHEDSPEAAASFDRVWEELWPSFMHLDRRNSQQDGAANGSQPIRSETNRASSAAGSRR
jgi:hypothetical protein